MVSAKLLVVALVFRFLEDLDFFFLDGIVNNRGCDGARSWTRGGGEEEHGLLCCVVASVVKIGLNFFCEILSDC